MATCTGEDKGRGERSLILIDPRTVTPVFPSGFCVSVESLGERGDAVVLLRFISVEEGANVPIITLALTSSMTRELVTALGKALERVEEPGEAKAENTHPSRGTVKP